jgi:hypothetical protein
MSLIQLSSKRSDNNNFTCYFNRGIEIKANSKIGLVSATLQHQKEDTAIITEGNNTLFMRFGYNPYLHRTIKVQIPVGKYSYASLAQIIELEISKKQNFLRFKTLTHLNNSPTTEFGSQPILPDDWLQFGSKVKVTTDETGKLTEITLSNYQVPSSNTGNVLNDGGDKLLHFAYKRAPSQYNLENVVPNHFEYDKFISYFDWSGLKTGPTDPLVITNYLNTENRGTQRQEGIPVILKEYISYDTDKNVVLSVKRPSAGTWRTPTARFVGLVSYGDIMESNGLRGLMTYMETKINGEIESPPCKVGVQFHDKIATIVTLNKQDNDSQEFGEGVSIDQRGIQQVFTDFLLDDSVDEYFVRFIVAPQGSTLGAGNQIKIQMSDTDDFAVLKLDVLTDPKKVFIGTKAFPLVPILINNNEFEDDEEASKIYINIFGSNTSTQAPYTRATILDSECEVSFPSDIPYYPEEVYPYNKNKTAVGYGYSAAATGDTEVRLWDLTDSMVVYLRGEDGELTQPYVRNINDLVSNRDLEIETLHPVQPATLGSVLGINKKFNVYTDEIAGAILGSESFTYTDVNVYEDFGSPSYHIQLNNLPVKALNSVNHSVTPTIAVISKTNVNAESTNITPNEVQFIDINNKEKMTINELSVRITNSDNTLTADLDGDVELICMIKS